MYNPCNRGTSTAGRSWNWSPSHLWNSTSQRMSDWGVEGSGWGENLRRKLWQQRMGRWPSVAWVGLMLCCPLLGYGLDWIWKSRTPMGKTCALGLQATSFLDCPIYFPFPSWENIRILLQATSLSEILYKFQEKHKYLNKMLQYFHPNKRSQNLGLLN